jgi:hypothetical protein
MLCCTTSDLNNLALVCKSFNEIARLCLANSVAFSGPTDSEDGPRYLHLEAPYSLRELPQIPCLWITDLKRLQRAFSESDVLRKGLRRAYVFWDAFVEGESSVKMIEEGIQSTAQLFCQAENLQFLHLSILNIKSQVPFTLSNITSLSVPLPPKRTNEGTSNYDPLLRFFKIPTLRKMHIKFDCRNPVPEHLHQPSCSNVTHLSIEGFSWFSEHLTPILEWPRDLQTFSIDCEIGNRQYLFFRSETQDRYDDFNGIYPAMEPLQHSLREFDYRYEIQWGRQNPFEACGSAFRPFEKLESVTVPLEMLMEFPDIYKPELDSTKFHSSVRSVFKSPLPGWAPPPHTRLPSSLCHLTLLLPWERIGLTTDPQIERMRYLENASKQYGYGDQVLQWLEGFIQEDSTGLRKSDHFPDIRSITLNLDRSKLIPDRRVDRPPPVEDDWMKPEYFSLVPQVEIRPAPTIQETLRSVGINLRIQT